MACIGVGDLSAEFDVEVTGNQGSISLETIEFGIRLYLPNRCSHGQATWQAVTITVNRSMFLLANESNELLHPKAQTSVRGPGRHRLRIANIDDQLMLWIDGGFGCI